MEKNVSHINAGAVHSGSGCKALNKIMGCADIPTPSNDLFQRYQKIAGEAIEKETKDSCKRAALEEKTLVIENISKLCKELPPEIVKDIYPHLNNHESSCPNNDPVLDPTLKIVDEFDNSLGQIINIIVSYATQAGASVKMAEAMIA